MVEILTLLIRILILVNSCRSNWLDQRFLSAHVIIFAYFIAIRSYGSGLYFFSRSEIDLSFFMFSQDVIYSVSDGLQLRISSSLSGRAGVGPKFRMFGFHRRSLFNLQLINSLPNYSFYLNSSHQFSLILIKLFHDLDLNINYTNKYMYIKWKRYFYLLYWNRAINMVSSKIKRLFASIGGVSG